MSNPFIDRLFTGIPEEVAKLRPYVAEVEAFNAHVADVQSGRPPAAKRGRAWCLLSVLLRWSMSDGWIVVPVPPECGSGMDGSTFR